MQSYTYDLKGTKNQKKGKFLLQVSERSQKKIRFVIELQGSILKRHKKHILNRFNGRKRQFRLFNVFHKNMKLY